MHYWGHYSLTECHRLTKIWLSVSAAFDTVDHNILITDLSAWFWISDCFKLVHVSIIFTLFVSILFSYLPLYTDVRLSHLNKDYLLTYLLIRCTSRFCSWSCITGLYTVLSTLTLSVPLNLCAGNTQLFVFNPTSIQPKLSISFWLHSKYSYCIILWQIGWKLTQWVIEYTLSVEYLVLKISS